MKNKYFSFGIIVNHLFKINFSVDFNSTLKPCSSKSRHLSDLYLYAVILRNLIFELFIYCPNFFVIIQYRPVGEKEK